MKTVTGFLLLLLPFLCFAQKPELVVPGGHSNVLTATTFSIDNKYFATSDGLNQIIVWETKSSRKIRTFSVNDKVEGLFFSSNNSYLSAITNSADWYAWDLNRIASDPLFQKKLLTERILNFTYSKSGREAIIQTGKNVFQLRSGINGKLHWEGEGSFVSFNASEDALLYGSKEVFLWDWKRKKKKRMFSLDQPIDKVKVLNNGGCWVLAGGHMNYYNPKGKATGVSFSVQPLDDNSQTVSPLTTFTNSNPNLYSSNSPATPEVMQWFSSTEDYFFEYIQFPASSVFFQKYFSKGESGFALLRKWDLNLEGTGDRLTTLSVASEPPFEKVYFSQDGQWLFKTSMHIDFADYFLIKHLYQDDQKRFRIGATSSSWSSKISDDGRYIGLVQTSGGDFYSASNYEIWDLESLNRVGKELNSAFDKIDFSRNSKLLFIDDIYSEHNVHWVDPFQEDTFFTVNLPQDIHRLDFKNIRSDVNQNANLFGLANPFGRILVWAKDNDDFPIIVLDVRDNIREVPIDWIHISDYADHLISCSENSVKVWALHSSKILFEVEIPGFGKISRLDSDDQGNLTITRLKEINQKKVLQSYSLNPNNGELEELSTSFILPEGIPETEAVNFKLSPGKSLLYHSESGYVWSVQDRKHLRQLSLEKRLLGFSANDKLYIELGPLGIEFRDVYSDELVLNFYNQEEWAVRDSSGLFDGPSTALPNFYFSVGMETIELEQLKARYYEPGLLQKLLGYSNEPIRPVEEFGELRLFPKVEAEIVDQTLKINLCERNGGIGRVSIFINGKEVVEEANPLARRENAKRDSIIHFDLQPHQKYLLRDSINTISIRVYNEAGWLKSPEYQLEYQMPKAKAKGNDQSKAGEDWTGRLDPKLFVVSIGTSDYAGTKLDLQYADQDATMMSKALHAVGAALFSQGEGQEIEVHCFTTTNEDSTAIENPAIHWQFASKNNIESTFETIKNEAKAEDVIVVYLSGHGVTYGSAGEAQFHYLTQGIASEDLSDLAIRQAYTISSNELTKWINEIPALKQVLIIDACNSGQIVENLTSGSKSLNSSQVRALDRMKDRTGMFVLSGSASDKVSYEASEYGQGLLTYALLQGMLGVATRKDTKGQETIDVIKLFQYARDQVPILANSINGIQTPMLGFPNQAASFDIGILDEKAKQSIPIGNKKPVLVKSLFMDKNTFQDDLKLSERLEVVFREETEKGSSADLIYVDVYNYPNAFSVSGLYEKTAEGIKIEVKLFKDRKLLANLDISPSDDPKRLARNIARAVKKQLIEWGDN